MKNLMNYSIAAEPLAPISRPAASSVRRLIRSLRSHEYFQEGQWTSNPDLADHYPDAGKVVAACIRHHLVDVELVLQLTTEPSGIFEMHLKLLDQPGTRSNLPFEVPVTAAA